MVGRIENEIIYITYVIMIDFLLVDLFHTQLNISADSWFHFKGKSIKERLDMLIILTQT